MKNSRYERSFCLTLSLALLLSLSVASSSTEAATPRQMVSTSLQSLSAHTNQLVQQVQFFLQSNGRWAPTPQGADMQLCQALQTFQNTVGKFNQDNSGNQPFATIQADFQQIAAQSQVLESMLQQSAKSPMVSDAWMAIRGDLSTINNSLYSMPGFNAGNFYDSQAGLLSGQSGSTFQPSLPNSNFNPINSGPLPYQYYGGSPYYPGFRPTNINITENSTFDNQPTFQGSFTNWPPLGSASPMGASPFANPGLSPGFTPGMPSPGFMSNPIGPHDQGQVMSNLRTASDQTERFIKDLTRFLQGKGKWPPPATSQEFQLCQNVQSFQLQLRKLGTDLQGNSSFALLKTEMKQIGSTSQNIDQLLMQIGATSDITGRWNEVRTAMNATYQAFFSAGTGNGSTWMR